MRSRETVRVVVAVLLAMSAAIPVLARQGPAPFSAAEVPATWTTGLDASSDRYTPHGRDPVELRFFLKPGAAPQAERIQAITHEALALFDEWFGPYPYPALTVVDAPWRGGQTSALPGAVIITTRWLTQARDMGVERELLAAIGRQYWRDVSAPEGPWFQEALSQYAATRAIHEVLRGRNFATYRFFGDIVPFTIRPLLLSPNPSEQRPRLTRFVEVDEAAAGSPEDRWRARRGVRALLTLERFLGWPALQQALLEYRHPTDGPPVDLSAVLTGQRGRSMAWFFEEAFRRDTRFDYAVTGLTSEPAVDGSGFVTNVSLRRHGDGIFAGTSEPLTGRLMAARSLPVAIGFDDDTEVRDWWDGRDEEVVLTYTSASRAAWASVDPEAFLMLDDNRANNTLRLSRPFHPTGARLAMNWLVWLQDVMLSYTGFL